MKKCLFILPFLVALFFTSCSNDNNPTEDNDKSIKKDVLIGTWESGNHFVSFNQDGYYSAYIADEFIDSGDFTLNQNVVSCKNNYFNRNSTYAIKKVSETELDVDILYKDLYGDTQEKSMTFTKTSTPPSSKDNTLDGKSIQWYALNFGNITMKFNSNNAGIKSAASGSAAKYPLDFFYIYIGNKMYHQILRNTSIQVPSIGGWPTSYNKVICWELHFSENGSIDSFEKIDL